MGDLVKFFSGWKAYAAAAALWASSLGGTYWYAYGNGHEAAETKCEAEKSEAYKNSFDFLAVEVQRRMEEINSRLIKQEELDKRIVTELEKEIEPIRKEYKEIIREKPIYISDDCSVDYGAVELLERSANLGAATGGSDR